MTKPYRDRRYMGQLIRPCVAADGMHKGKRIIQSYHLTGIPYSEKYCPHYQTIAEVKEDIKCYVEISECAGDDGLQAELKALGLETVTET